MMAAAKNLLSCAARASAIRRQIRADSSPEIRGTVTDFVAGS